MSTTTLPPPDPPRRVSTAGAVPDGVGRLHSLRDALTRALGLVDAEIAAADPSPRTDASEPVPTVSEYIAAIRGGGQ